MRNVTMSTDFRTDSPVSPGDVRRETAAALRAGGLPVRQFVTVADDGQAGPRVSGHAQQLFELLRVAASRLPHPN